MTYFLKFAIAMWVAFPATALLSHYLGSGLMLIIAIALLFGILVYTSAIGAEKRAKNRAEAAEYWLKPWWQCVVFGVLIWAPAYTLHGYLESVMDGYSYQLVPNMISGAIAGCFFGLAMNWCFRYLSLTAQSDSSGT